MSHGLPDLSFLPPLRDQRFFDAEEMTADYIIARFEEAGKTLYCLPGGFYRKYSDKPDYMVPTPTAREISRMDETYSWLRFIPLDKKNTLAKGQYNGGGAVLRKLVVLRGFTHLKSGRHVYSWRSLGETFRASHMAVKAWHEQGIHIILKNLKK